MLSCLECNREITEARRKKFCSDACQYNAQRKKLIANGAVSSYPHLSGPTVGALHELSVAADLIKRGYEVFRAVSAACPCDLVILAGKKTYRVEVTTGYQSLATGKLAFPKHDSRQYDIIAIVVGQEIHYRGLPLTSFIPASQ